MTEAHYKKLDEYGLLDIAPAACVCLLFEAGETVLYEGEPIRWFSIVIGGRAKVCRTAANGKTLILSYYMSEGMIGEIELLTNRDTASTEVVAISDFTCIVIDYQACRIELAKNVKFLYKLGSALAEKLSQSAESFSASALCSGKQRLCAYILQTANQNIFSDVLTEVACSVGVSYRHMFRLLEHLCAEGVLAKTESGYRILRPGKLRELASQEAPYIS